MDESQPAATTLGHDEMLDVQAAVRAAARTAAIMEALLHFARTQQEQYPQEGGYFDGIQQVTYDKLPRVTAVLLEQGYTEQEVRGILGENWLRVLGCWAGCGDS